MPLPQMLKIIIVARAISAKGQFMEALETAEPASPRPIQIIIGPVTTGGKNLMIFFTPTTLIANANTRYSNPATTIPPHAYASLSALDISAYFPVFRDATVANPPRNANEEPKKAGTLNFDTR